METLILSSQNTLSFSNRGEVSAYLETTRYPALVHRREAEECIASRLAPSGRDGPSCLQRPSLCPSGGTRLRRNFCEQGRCFGTPPPFFPGNLCALP